MKAEYITPIIRHFLSMLPHHITNAALKFWEATPCSSGDILRDFSAISSKPPSIENMSIRYNETSQFQEQ